ncbi:MAG: magnesium transporter [Planktomarina sp.]|jgi:magnesium transporter
MTDLYVNPPELSDVLDSQRVLDVRAAVEHEDVTRLHMLLDPLHPADIADLLEQVSDGLRSRLLHMWKGGIVGDVLSELDESIREDIIDGLNATELADAVRDLDSDDVVDLLENLDEPQQEAILDALDDAERMVVEQSLSFPHDSAGRLMQREVVMAPEHWTVGQAIDYLRRHQDLPEQFYHIILIDPRMRPTGYVTLGKLLGATTAAPLQEIIEDSFRTIPAEQPEKDVAYAFNHYHLISAPVVDADNRLVGVITIDDAMTVLDEEYEEDMMRLAGVGEGSLSDHVIETLKGRFPWLAVNLCTAIVASMVISMFEATIAQFVALAVLMPIVASMGGNAGTQSLTVAVRAIATKNLTTSNVWRVIRREVLVGLLNGIIFAVVLGLVGFFWFGSSIIGWVLALAMVLNMVIAGLAGTVVPVLLEKIGVDPALASGAFVTTVTDVVGFFAFLGLAAWMLL